MDGTLLGAFAANFMIFSTNQAIDNTTAIIISIIIAGGNTAEALVGKYLVKKIVPHFNTDTFLDTVDDILQFFFDILVKNRNGSLHTVIQVADHPVG